MISHVVAGTEDDFFCVHVFIFYGTEMSLAWICEKLLHVLISYTVVASFPCIKTHPS
jgi:hypothetical protein